MTQSDIAKRILKAANMPAEDLAHALAVGAECRRLYSPWFGGSWLDEKEAAGLLHDFIEDCWGTADFLFGLGVMPSVIDDVEALNFAALGGTYGEKVLGLTYSAAMVKYADCKVNLERCSTKGDLELRYRKTLLIIRKKFDLAYLPWPDPRHWHKYDNESRKVARVLRSGGQVTTVGPGPIRHP